MYGDVVLGLKPETKTRGGSVRGRARRRRSARAASTLDTELDADALRELVDEFKALIKMRRGVVFPEDPAGAALGRDRRRLRLVEQRRAPSPTAS